MIEFVTVWFMVACVKCNSSYSDRFVIPYATQEICLKQANKFKERRYYNDAICQFGQLPIHKHVVKK